MTDAAISYFSTAIDYTRNRAASDFIRNSRFIYCFSGIFNFIYNGLVFLFDFLTFFD